MKMKTIEMAETQKGIYFDCQIENSISYNVSASILLEHMEAGYLENAFKILVHEQDALRSDFSLEDGIPVMNVHDKVECRFHIQDLSENCRNQEEQIRGITKEVIGTPFDLEKAPLFRTMLVKKSETQSVFIVCCHHLISDGISMGILMQKLFHYYDDLRNGRNISLVKDCGFTNFIEIENQKLSAGHYTDNKKFWEEKLKGAEALALQADFANMQRETVIGKEKRFEIPSGLLAQIESLSMDCEVTVFTFFLSAFQILLSKYTRSEDVTVSSPFSYRPDIDLEETIGCFVQMLPIRCNMIGNSSFTDIVTQVSYEFIQAYKHIGYPNNLILRDSSLVASPGMPSILDVSFVYDIYEEMKVGAGTAKVLDQDMETFAGNMMVILNKTPEKDVIKIQYMPDLYSEHTIELIGKRFLKLLQVLVSDINIKVEEIDLLLEDERERILDDFNQSSFLEYSPQTVIEIFQSKVQQYPNKTALIYGNQKETYDAVNQKVNQLSRKIQLYKQKEYDVVGLQMDRSPNLIISILAILKAGCAYVPIDDSYPDSRKEFIFEDASISLLLTSRDLSYDDSWKVYLLFVDDPDTFTGDSDNPAEILDPYSLAYIEYTSGSTGQPKGVMIEHHSLVNTLLDLERRFPLQEQDTYMFKTAFSFDVSGTEIYGWFMGEGSLLILESGGEKDPECILDAIETYEITHINFVPSMFRLFLELFEQEKNIKKLRSLKWIFVGGEAVTLDLIRKFNGLNTNIKLENVYGPTECTIWASHYSLADCEGKANIPIGNPLNEIRWYVVGERDELQPIGIPGELCLSGVGLARGYLNREELTQEKFISNPFFRKGVDPEYFGKMYRTGDLVRWMPDGNIEFMGRIDFQVKIRGVRLELGEIENALMGFQGMIQAVVITKDMPNNATILCAYYLSKSEISSTELREYLTNCLPAYMVPSFFVHKKSLPLNSSGKIDRKVLIADTEHLKNYSIEYVAPVTEMEKAVADIWRKVLSIEKIGLDENFFDRGGHSVALMDVHNKLKKQLNCQCSIAQLFNLPTIRLQASYLSNGLNMVLPEKREKKTKKNRMFNRDIAIIGMSIKVPGSDSIEGFWDVLKNGEESIHFYSDKELEELGISEEMIKMPNYIKAKGRVDGIEYFDPKFFDYTPGDMKLMPPQLRLLYKGAWEVMEDAGYYPDSTDSKIGIFIGGSDDFEWYSDTILGENNYSDKYQAFTFSTNHFLATRLAYKFNIRGPVYTTLTGCSTSLVTPHLSCQSLILGECDMAIAGGVTVELPNEGGYLYEDGMMFSPDGHCRPFDEDAKGTVFSNGMGLVVLKRLEDALEDGDHIYAVIKGSAINNDGNQKVGFAAPSVQGQVEVIQSAYEAADIDPETIDYIEAHGTGTSLGDPIEVESLSTAFNTEKRQFCVLGSVKGNVGHTDTAAGIVGLEKVALSLYHKFIPATVNYKRPNAKINFKKTPFLVNNYGTNWSAKHKVRRAGINSFGIGGTNAHMVLEEAPNIRESHSADETNLLVFSAKSEAALMNTSRKIMKYLVNHERINLSDAAWTLQVGRKAFSHRKAIIINSDFRENSKKYLEELESAIVTIVNHKAEDIYFMFSGQGNQYQGMGRDLYINSEKSEISRIYKYHIDQVFSFLKEEKEEFLEVMYGERDPSLINQTKYSQFALFATEYSIAKTLLDLGIKPKGLLGHSIGEVAAAVVAGIWDLKDGVEIVLARGNIMQKQERGVMLAVMADHNEVEKRLPDGVWIALNNTTNKCVVGGAERDIIQFETRLKSTGWSSIRVKTSHAFHTPMMNLAAGEFKEFVSQYTFHEPNIPIVSNLSGTWAEEQEMTNADYWAEHIIKPVNFDGSLKTILESENGIFIEVGSGRTLCTFAMQHKSKKANQHFINLCRHPKENRDDVSYINHKLGVLWTLGVCVNWDLLKGKSIHNRISLPTYVFDEMHFPIASTVSEIGKNKAASMEPVEIRTCKDVNELEVSILAAYESIFGLGGISPSDNFFDIGGDSLKGVSLSAVIRNTIGIKVDVAEIFNYPTSKALAEYLGQNINNSIEENEIVPIEERSYYPLSSAQSRMYMLYQMDKTNIAFNLPSATIIDGAIDKQRFETAFKKLVMRHESLRTSFEIRENQTVQIIHQMAPISFYYERRIRTNDLEIDSLIHEFIQPFDLEKAPLLRVGLIEIGENRYVMLFDIHHIVADGTSVEIISRDFNHLYGGDLPEHKIHYKDYAVWQNQYIHSGEIEEQKQFWLKNLGGELPVLELPADYERPQVKNFKGSRIHFKLKKELSQKINKMAHEVRGTNYMVMLSVWNVLLARYSGQEDIIVGTPTAGRNQEEIQETVGMFVNMLAMRNKPNAQKKFSDFLMEVKENSLQAFQNQDYQFDVLTEQLGLKRELNRNMLFDVCFDYQNMEFYDLEIEGIRFTPYDFDANAASYDLVLTCQESKAEIECFLDYSTSLFKEETMERLIQHFERILESITDDREIMLGHIDMITSEEKLFLKEKVNHTTLPIDETILLQELFEKNASKYPNKTALIVSDGRELSYKELNEKSNRLAWELIGRGVGNDDLIGIMPLRDENLFVSILGILKAGAAYVPIDPKFPEDRISYMIEKGEIHTLICPKAHSDSIHYKGNTMDCNHLSIREDCVENPERRSCREGLACVIFTSGSTGNPKGVMVNQESMVNFVFDILDRGIFRNKEERVICITTISFDIFGFESITPLCTGNSIYLANEQEQLDPVLANKKIIQYGVTHILSTVSRIKAFVDNPYFGEALKQLTCILSGGENYPLELLKDLQERSDAKIYNMYGPTETTIWSTTKDLTHSDTINIGKPIANTEVYILNDSKKMQPVGIYGELCLAGRGLARGYLKNPEETNDKFITIHGTDILAYRTGDRARIGSSGEVELLGRLDSQVKIRGYRIELSEIEKTAQHNEYVNQAALIVFDDKNQDKQLALFYNLKEKQEKLQQDSIWLKKWLESQLPHYMIPSQFIMLEKMPTLPNGKLNKKALYIPDLTGAIEKMNHLPTRKTDITTSLQEIWKEVLGVDGVSIKDNFFDIGGNSLGLILVNNKISKLLDSSIPLMQLFENPTIESLVKSLGMEQTSIFEEPIRKECIQEEQTRDIAVVGMACHFPGADNIEEFWQNILTGTESLTKFTDEELQASGIDHELLSDPNYMKVKGYLDGVEYFDSDFFNYSQRESNGMDPQMRALHECAWNALENGGYDSSEYDGKIGLFAGSSSNVLWMARSLGSKNDILNAFETMTLNEKDFLTTKISYKLNLKGPSMNIQTACSTSLTAVHQAIESLLRGESDMALAGGVSISFPRKEGYLWHEGMIFSKDGHCRPFSDDASGTISGNGCGLVLLKPLQKAKEDGDHIYAVIKSSAINNDGLEKIGYTAPSISGQSRVIRDALNKSAVGAEEINYLETHGTGTELGDPIEIEALKQAWRTEKTNYCALGSVKANIGHLDAAAGIAGFIKTVLVLENRTIPPLINFNEPNRRIDFDHSPFYINTKAKPVGDEIGKFRAGVSSFGIGGTNVHLILEEALSNEVNPISEPIHNLVFSARSQEALNHTSNAVLQFISSQKEIDLTGAAWTLQSGRRSFEYRKALVVKGSKINVRDESVKNFLLDSGYKVSDTKQPLIFLLSGGNGSMDITKQLWDTVDGTRVSQVYQSHFDQVWVKMTEKEHQSTQYIGFAVEYAIAKAFMDMGLIPEVVLCQGIGEISALAVSEVIRIEEAFQLIRAYSGKIQQIKTGTILSSVLEHSSKEPLLSIMEAPVQGQEKKFVGQPILLNLGYVNMDAGFYGIPTENMVHFFGNSSEFEMGTYFNQAISKIWVLGYPVNWEKLRGNTIIKRIPLPGYIFDKKYHENDVLLSSFNFQYGMDKKEVKEEGKQEEYLTKLQVKQELSEIWMELLGCQSSNIEQDFFELGGHSLTAISLVSLVKNRFGVNLSLAEIFDHTTLEEMTERIFTNSHAKVEGQIVEIERKDVYEVSSAQKRMYAVNEFSGDAVPYNLASAYIMKGELEKERWEEAFCKLVIRHESFRTRFEMRGNDVVQIIEDDLLPDLEFADIKEEDLECAMGAFIRPFDLAKAPLLRIKIFTIHPRKHLFAIDMHHIISDQSSIAILLDELNELYLGNELPPLNIQYKDFANWQNNFLKSQDMEAQIAYWKHEFSGEIPVLEFMTDYERSETVSYHGDHINYDFGEELSKKVTALAKKQGITPYMLLFSSFNLLLWKFTGQKDLVVGTGIAGRKHQSLSTVVGMFVNTLAIRSQIDTNMTISQYLNDTKEKMIGAFENQDCQFETLLEALNIKMNLIRNPLFDIMFNYVNMGTQELFIDGLELEAYDFKDRDTKFDLTITIEECEGIYRADFEYARELFQPQTIKRLGDKFIEFIDGITEHIDQMLTQISLVNKKEEKWLLLDLNQTETPSPLSNSAVELFEDQVKKNGKNQAVLWNGVSNSYEELNQRANWLALQLTAQKVSYQDKVAILLDRGPMQIISILAILKCGAVYVPIDPEYPAERIDFILKDSDAKLLLTRGCHGGKFSSKVEMLILEENLMNTGISATFESYKTTGEDRIYIIYTSGSTGMPKGTLICNKSVIRVVKETNYIEINETDRVMQLSNYAFDGSIFDIFGALLNGACITMIPKETAVDMEKLSNFIRVNKITMSFIPTALFNMLVEWDVTALKGIRKIMIGGEEASVYHSREAVKFLGSGHLINGYGPTETCVFATYYPIDFVEEDALSIPIGYALAHTSLYILDEVGQLVPPEMSGELYIGGAGVAQGYLNQEELTKEKFLTLPFHNRERVYRTGDKVMWSATGKLLFLGRTDYQIKIRGFRVELGEIEKQIRMISGMKEAIVTAQKDRTGSLYMSAYYTAESLLTPDYIKSELNKKLPDYMIPARMKSMESLPLTLNGKVDRKKLPVIEEDQKEVKKEDQPKNEAEQIILNKMRLVLDNQTIGVKDNFFENGGQSIKAIAFVQSLSRDGIRVKVNEIFQFPTVEKLADLPEVKKWFGEIISEYPKEKDIEEQGIVLLDDQQMLNVMKAVYNSGKVLSNVILTSHNVNCFPISPIQKLHSILGSDHSGFTMYVDGNLKEHIMREILTKIIQNNQLLHCKTEDETEGKWQEYDISDLTETIEKTLSYTDLRSYEKSVREKLVSKLYMETLLTSYEESQLPWRLCSLRLMEERHLIIWGFDHRVFDGMSAEIIKSQIEKAAGVYLNDSTENSENDHSSEESQNYENYVALLEEGPFDITEEEMIRAFSLKSWEKKNKDVGNVLHQIPERSFKKMTIKIPLPETEDFNPWWYAYGFIYRIMSRYTQNNEVSLGIVDYGRSYGDNGFYNCIGEFLDIIPIQMQKEDQETDVSKLMKTCESKHINFLSLLYDEELSLCYPELVSLLKSAYIAKDETLNMILYNFQGYISKEEKEAFVGEEGNENYIAKFLITVNYDEENLNIELECKDGLNCGIINDVIYHYADIYPVVDIAC